MKNIIKANNICYSEYIKNISFTAYEGEILAIKTDSAYVSSAILSIICGLIVPESGTITINSKKPEVSFFNYGYFFTSGSGEINFLMLNNMLETYGIISRKFESNPKTGYTTFIKSLLSLPEILLIGEPVSSLFCKNAYLLKTLKEIVVNENKLCVITSDNVSYQEFNRFLCIEP